MDHAEAMFNKLIEAAQSVGGAAWPLYVERVYYGAAVAVYSMAVLLLIAAVVCITTRGKPMTRDSAPTGWLFVRVISIIAACAFTVGLLVNLPIMLSPAGEAVMRIIGR